MPECQLVIVNVLDIPVDTAEVQKEDLAFWAEFDKRAREAADEGLQIEDWTE